MMGKRGQEINGYCLKLINEEMPREKYYSRHRDYPSKVTTGVPEKCEKALLLVVMNPTKLFHCFNQMHEMHLILKKKRKDP